jgi:hypothetical protein
MSMGYGKRGYGKNTRGCLFSNKALLKNILELLKLRLFKNKKYIETLLIRTFNR